MKIVTDVITNSELKKMADNMFGNMVKAVVDIEKEVIAVDGELHADLEALLLSKGSEQKSLWGINIYPELDIKEYIEFDSMINIRPSQANMSRSVEDEKIRLRIVEIVSRRVKR